MPRWTRFPAYVSAASRKARASLAARRLEGAEPIRIEGRDITTTFWGKAWCENLQAYADFAYRLDRGRSYVRSGAVVDLKIEAGRITARVSGSALYQVEITMGALAPARWQEIARAATGRIHSLVALLRGELPDELLLAVTDRETGLFPKPRELQMSCDCPDRAVLCKHVGASLYGVGARLDARPELLFLLRGVDAKDLVERATAGLAAGGPATSPSAPTLSGSLDELSALFGVELTADTGPPPPPPPRRKKTARKPKRPRAGSLPVPRPAKRGAVFRGGRRDDER